MSFVFFMCPSTLRVLHPSPCQCLVASRESYDTLQLVRLGGGNVLHSMCIKWLRGVDQPGTSFMIVNMESPALEALRRHAHRRPVESLKSSYHEKTAIQNNLLPFLFLDVI